MLTDEHFDNIMQAVARAVARNIALGEGSGRGWWGPEHGGTHVAQDPQFQVGITSHRKAPERAFQRADLQEFRSAMSNTPITDFDSKLGRGGWKNDDGSLGQEPTFITQYNGDGEAVKALATFGKKYNQDGVLLQRYCDKSEPGAQPQVRIAFNDKISPGERGRIETMLKEISMGGKGFGGWTWARQGGKRVLMLTNVPQWGGEADKHMRNCAKLMKRLRQTGHSASHETRTVRVTTMDPSNYDDFISGKATAAMATEAEAHGGAQWQT